MAHPHHLVHRQPVKQHRTLALYLGPAVFPLLCRFYSASQHLVGHLHSVADSKNRDASFENSGVALGCIRVVDAVGAAREDNALHIAHSLDCIQGKISWVQLAVDSEFTDTAGYKLVILASEIQYYYFVHTGFLIMVSSLS